MYLLYTSIWRLNAFNHNENETPDVAIKIVNFNIQTSQSSGGRHLSIVHTGVKVDSGLLNVNRV